MAEVLIGIMIAAAITTVRARRQLRREAWEREVERAAQITKRVWEGEDQ